MTKAQDKDQAETKSKSITLFCREAPELKLGPNGEIVFTGGFASVDTGEFPDWETWANHAGTPFIREVKGGPPSENETRCPVCGDAQKDAAALTAHYGGEHPPKPVPLQPADQRTVVVHEIGGKPVLVQPPAEPLPTPPGPAIILPDKGKTMVAQEVDAIAPVGGPAKSGTTSAPIEQPTRAKAAEGGETASKAVTTPDAATKSSTK